MEEQKKEINKRWKISWIVFDVFLFGLFFSLLIFVYIHTKDMNYLDGLNDTSNAFIFVFYAAPFFVGILLYFFVLLMRLYYWKNLIQSKRILWGMRILMFALLFFAVSFLFLLRQDNELPYIKFTKGFQQRMRERLNVENIRAWMGTLDEKIFDGEYYDILYQMNGNALPVPMPQEISSLSKKVHYLVFYKENQMRCLRIEWGGPFKRWGVVVGPKEMPIPPTIPWTSEDGHGEYRVKFEDGVYIWHMN